MPTWTISRKTKRQTVRLGWTDFASWDVRIFPCRTYTGFARWATTFVVYEYAQKTIRTSPPSITCDPEVVNDVPPHAGNMSCWKLRERQSLDR